MAYFEWASDLEIDQGPIDQDHRKLVDQVNELHTATTQGRGHEIVGRLLQELERDTLAHIQREEQFLHSVGYPETEAHHRQHERFVEELRDLRRQFGEGRITVAAQLSQALRDWLSLHIRRSDMDVKRFLQQRARQQHRGVSA